MASRNMSKHMVIQDDGKDIDGYYVTTENHTMYFCKQGGFKRKEVLVK